MFSVGVCHSELEKQSCLWTVVPLSSTSECCEHWDWTGGDIQWKGVSNLSKINQFLKFKVVDIWLTMFNSFLEFILLPLQKYTHIIFSPKNQKSWNLRMNSYMMHSPPPQIENIFSKNYVAYSNKYFMIVILWKYSYGDEWWCLYDKDRHMYNQAQVLRIMWVHSYVQFLVSGAEGFLVSCDHLTPQVTAEEGRQQRNVQWHSWMNTIWMVHACVTGRGGLQVKYIRRGTWYGNEIHALS